MPTDQNVSAPLPKRTFFHPSSGMAILGLDWLLFSGNVLTGGAATPLVCLLGFVAGIIATTACQRYAGRSSWGASLLKGVCAGIVVGVPFPIFGTFVGGGILAASGLSSLKKGRVQQEVASLEPT
ncbi:MAG: phosphoribosylaminoimidazole carboxylase [Nitrospiraceae bacterium]|nr:phosphoribosylaminoimidazole carboxylase [Nitrospiraceae bacterium]